MYGDRRPRGYVLHAEQDRYIHATRDKRARAAPVAMLYEQAIPRSARPSPRAFAAFEEQTTTSVGASEREEKSSDLLDSCVWAHNDLFLDTSVSGVPSRPAAAFTAGRR
ncbi:hypothetical protein OG241_24705 [Streptomyces sp. NBC_01390]|uniref:phage terminase large subunit family protein n=1 Tax=Streptomyces sp. NBC_01390 TaxID=2903850 RepID=UPI003243D951